MYIKRKVVFIKNRLLATVIPFIPVSDETQPNSNHS